MSTSPPSCWVFQTQGIHKPVVIFLVLLKAQVDFPFQELLQMAFCWGDKDPSCLLSALPCNTFRSGRAVTALFCLGGIKFLLKSTHPGKTLCWRDPRQLPELYFDPAGCIWSSSCPSAVDQWVFASLSLGLLQVSRTQQGQPFPLLWHPSSQLETSSVLL